MKFPTRQQIVAVLRSVQARIVNAARRVVAAGLSAFLWFLLMGAAGMALVIAGVFVLLGFGWALIAAGAFLLFTAALIGRGMTNGSA